MSQQKNQTNKKYHAPHVRGSSASALGSGILGPNFPSPLLQLKGLGPGFFLLAFQGLFRGISRSSFS